MLLMIEFRHTRWINERGMELLRELDAGYCIVDMPQVRNLPRAEWKPRRMWPMFGSMGKTRQSGLARQRATFREWVEPIMNLTKYVEQTYVYFNNHYRAKAAKNAQMLQQLLATGTALPLKGRGP